MPSLSPPNGVYVASLTPMQRDGSVDYSKLSAHCKWLLGRGSDGIVLLGTTGEANAFSVSERMKILEAVLEHGVPPEKLIVGTGCCAIPDTIALTRHAQHHQAGGILMLPPFYYKQVSDQGIADYFSRVIEGVSGEGLRIFLYHFPKMTGIPFSVELTEKLVQTFPGVIVGMKDSGGERRHMLDILNTIPGFRLFAGSEEFLQDVLRAGGSGCISATANLISNYAAKVYTNRHDPEVDSSQAHLTALRKAFGTRPFVSTLKQLMARYTNDLAWRNMRPPNAPVSEDHIQEILDRLKVLGFRDPDKA